MNKFLIYAVTLIVLLAFNIAFPPILGAAPNLLFLLVIFYAFRQEKTTFLWLAFFSGLLLDLTSNFVFGSFTISFLLVSFLISYATRIFFTADVTVLFMVIVTIVSYLLLIGILYLFSSMALSFELTAQSLPVIYLRHKIWFDLVLNLVFAAPVYFLTEYLEKIILRIESRNTNPQ
jgi:rod shape-determining protein MreD